MRLLACGLRAMAVGCGLGPSRAKGVLFPNCRRGVAESPVRDVASQPKPKSPYNAASGQLFLATVAVFRRVALISPMTNTQLLYGERCGLTLS
jgi:hypothetical protein